MQQSGWALEYVCEELKKDGEICLAAVQQVITTYKATDYVHGEKEKLLFVKEQIQKEVLPQTFLHDVAKFGLCWDEGMKELVGNAGQEIFQQDTESGLYPCMLVASSNRSDVGTVYEMLKHFPEILPQQQASQKKQKRSYH